MAASGVGRLHFIEGKKYAEHYEVMLSSKMLPSAAEFEHKERRMEEYLIGKLIKVLEWPLQSPDLNPIMYV